jgi:hypothetical protein
VGLALFVHTAADSFDPIRAVDAHAEVFMPWQLRVSVGVQVWLRR